MKQLLTPDQCILILKENNCSKEVINHCRAVRDLAVKIAEKTNADRDLVEVGALLHDIGRSKTHGIRHAVEGVKIAKKLGLNDKVIKIIERHIGAGISKEEAKKLGLPAKDYNPVTLEEKIVCHADNLIDNSKRKSLEVELEKALEKGLNEYALKLVKLHKELSEIYGMDLNKI
jgi:tRNA (cytidine56-2'-O)-methyltransferase